jgi:hypothetical protein
MGPLAEADRDYGRCSVRLLDFLGAARAYLIVRRSEDARPRRVLWALLHEVGHFLNHYELLLSVGTLYQRLCMNPPLEMDVGRFAQRAAPRLHAQTELEADLFAVDWLLPRWIDDDELVRSEAPRGLNVDGYRFYRLRDALDDRPAQPVRRISFDRLNDYGSEERRRSAESFPSGGSRWKRASWVLFNRNRLHSTSGLTEMMDEYHELAGNPRFVPELTRRPRAHAAFDRELAWIRRVAASDIAREVDSVQWAPLLVPGADAERPEYYIPIRPVGARDPRDSRLGWRHMMAPALSAPLDLETWLDRGREQRAGVLLFPRNPAERSLDTEGLLRV